MNYIARKYRYADGKAYRPNIYVIYEADGIRSVGGAVVLGDKALAYAGHPGLCQDKVADIIKRADAYAWGNTIQEALAKIKPALNGEL